MASSGSFVEDVRRRGEALDAWSHTYQEARQNGQSQRRARAAANQAYAATMRRGDSLAEILARVVSELRAEQKPETSDDGPATLLGQPEQADD